MSVAYAQQRVELIIQFSDGIHHEIVDQHQSVVIRFGTAQHLVNVSLKAPQLRMLAEKSVPLYQGCRVFLCLHRG